MSKTSGALLKAYEEAHGHVPAVEHWMLLNTEPDAISVMEFREQIVLYSDYVETPRYYLFFVTPSRVICYNKAGGAKPAGKHNEERLVQSIRDTTGWQPCTDIDLSLIDMLIGDYPVDSLGIEGIASKYCDLKGYFIYTNGTRGLWYKSGRVYAKDASYSSENSSKLREYFRSIPLTTLRKVLDAVLADHDGEVARYVVERRYEQMRGPVKCGRIPVVHETPILMLDKDIDIFPDGFFVRVNLANNPHDELLHWLSSGGREEVLTYIADSFYPKFLRRIGSLDFYCPVEMTLLRAKQVQVEYRVKKEVEVGA